MTDLNACRKTRELFADDQYPPLVQHGGEHDEHVVHVDRIDVLGEVAVLGDAGQVHGVGGGGGEGGAGLHVEDVAGGGQRAAVRRLQEHVQPTCNHRSQILSL